MNQFYTTYLKPLFFGKRFYFVFVCIILCFIVSFWANTLFAISQILILALTLLVMVDYIVLFAGKGGLKIERIVADRLSNGDENKVRISITNHYQFPVSLSIIDELPVQFQNRKFKIKLRVKEGEEQTATYPLRPVERGEYEFNDVNV